MKISKIYIQDYNQFKEFNLDLTYPKGHPKEGRPLDKICIIGQSGTGKTSLLLFIKKALNFLGGVSKLEQAPHSTYEEYLLGIESAFSVGFKGNAESLEELSFHSPKKFAKNPDFNPNTGQEAKTFLSFSNKGIMENYNAATGPPGTRGLRHQQHAWKFLSTQPFGYLYFPADLINFKDEPEDLIENSDTNFQGIGLGNGAAKLYWNKILEEIKAYEETYIEKSVELSKNEQLRPTFEGWLKTAHNPLKTLAEELLDDILRKFNLRVKQNTSFRRKEDIGTIKIETLQGAEIPAEGWSTGTKQLIFSALPLFALKSEKKTILFDEPERSLYPDIQTQLVDILTKKTLTNDCQFFFATHSPLVASSFDPWEIVELKFKEDGAGAVYQEQYFEGERHVDNYNIHPKLLRWDGILQRVFDLDAASQPERGKVLSELASLKKVLKRNDISEIERNEKWQKYSQLAASLNWDFDEEEHRKLAKKLNRDFDELDK